MSDTVRALTRSVIPVRYIPPGRHRLTLLPWAQDFINAISLADSE
jgi:hypothetical protein